MDGYPMARAGMRGMLQAPDVRVAGEVVRRAEALRLVGHLLHQATQQDTGRATTLAGRPTAPEHEVLRLITDGRTHRAIPQMLGYRVGTAKNHVQKVIGKLEASDRTQAAVEAVRLGLVEAAVLGSKR